MEQEQFMKKLKEKWKEGLSSLKPLLVRHGIRLAVFFALVSVINAVSGLVADGTYHFSFLRNLWNAFECVILLAFFEYALREIGMDLGAVRTAWKKKRGIKEETPAQSSQDAEADHDKDAEADDAQNGSDDGLSKGGSESGQEKESSSGKKKGRKLFGKKAKGKQKAEKTSKKKKLPRITITINKD